MRRYAITAVAALAAAGLTVGLTLATRTTPPKPHRQAGLPPLVLDLGVRTDPEAVALRRASTLYDQDKAEQAGPIFGRYSSLEAKVGAALSAWRDSASGSYRGIAELAREHPRSSLVQLAYGIASYWRGDQTAAEAAWRA